MMSRQNKAYISEEFRISLNLTLKKFRQNPEEKELEFPSSFTSGQRAYIHRFCLKGGLKSKSRGTGANRYLTIYKKEESTVVQADASFFMNKRSQQNVVLLLQRFPLTARERQDLLPPAERDRLLPHSHDARDMRNHLSGRLGIGIPQVPPGRCDMEALPFQQSLPIWTSREEIIQSIVRHQVVLISGETGSGKTTQVPQYILDHCGMSGIPTRIICTQPRRIAAVSLAERVALERGEKVGQTVGYQIRLENRVSCKTLLTFCTGGILLRSLMNGDAFAATLTHIIVDELHERDKYSDFLLIILRDLLLKFRSLKLILMSAVLDTQLFVKYFGGCPVIEVPGRIFEVKPFFLEDILKSTKYMTKAMRKYKINLGKMKSQQHQLEAWCSSVNNKSAKTTVEEERPASPDVALEEMLQQVDVIDSSDDLDPTVAAKYDSVLHDAWLTGSDESFCLLLNMLVSDNIPVDWQHREASVSALMVAAGRGNVAAIEQLLCLGANIFLRSSNDWNALDFAKQFEQKQIIELLEAHKATCNPLCGEPKETASENKLSEEDKILLDAYQHGIDEERIDSDLIIFLIRHICYSMGEGGILVFLPGYDDIVTIRDRIFSEEKNFPDPHRMVIYTLHSQMQNSDQKCVFKPVPQGVRKVILSTNIAETSITINDVVFVIDSGKVKEKTFDALMGTTQLKTSWISQATAVQRRGRAGRCRSGLSFHLFSQMRFSSQPKFQVPEILRVPIHELCLQAKLLAPPNVPIADFLARAPDPPPFMVTRNAVLLLKTIDALDPWEELTELGLHLLDLPIEPRLGKMILYSVFLKCVDPVLTIVCALSYKDPFLLPSRPSEKKNLNMMKRKLACNVYSDHLALLRAFQLWQKAKVGGYDLSFCNKNYISSATMEMIVGMRTQLFYQLKASGFIRSRSGIGDLRDLNSNADVWPVVRAAICGGTYPNLIRIDRERQQLITQKESKVMFHPSSVLSKYPGSGKQNISSLHKELLGNLPTDWLIYEELSRTGHTAQAHCCTLVSPITVSIFCGPGRLPLDALHDGTRLATADSDSEDEIMSDTQKSTLKLDDWMSFKVDPEVARLALQLRQKWHALFLRRIHSPMKPWTQGDETIIRTLTTVLVAEEEEILRCNQASSGAVTKRASAEPNASYSPYQKPQQIIQRPVFSSEGAEIRDFSRASFGNIPGYRQAAVERHRGPQMFSSSEVSDYTTSLSVDSGSINTTPLVSPGSSTLNHMFKTHSQTRYFVIKAQHPKALEMSFYNGTWAFSPMTERKLLSSFKEGKEIILIFSLQGSGQFQGVARFTPRITEQRTSEHHQHPGRFYLIEWLKKGNIPFQSTRHLQNAWNENKKVQISRDGQELEPSVGEALRRMWDHSGMIHPYFESKTQQQQQLQQQQQQQQQFHPSRRPWYNTTTTTMTNNNNIRVLGAFPKS